MPSPAERRLVVEPFLAKYAQSCPLVRTAAISNVSQLIDLVVRQKVYDSAGRMTYRQALEEIFRDDLALKKAYGDD